MAGQSSWISKKLKSQKLHISEKSSILVLNKIREGLYCLLRSHFLEFHQANELSNQPLKIQIVLQLNNRKSKLTSWDYVAALFIVYLWLCIQNI
jgi:hypothetical protein